MRFMVIVKATPSSEAGDLPDEKLLTEMTAYNEELAQAGVMLAGEGRQPSSPGGRVRLSGEDGESDVWGKRVEHGGCRIVKKKKRKGVVYGMSVALGGRRSIQKQINE